MTSLDGRVRALLTAINELRSSLFVQPHKMYDTEETHRKAEALLRETNQDLVRFTERMRKDRVEIVQWIAEKRRLTDIRQLRSLSPEDAVALRSQSQYHTDLLKGDIHLFMNEYACRTPLSTLKRKFSHLKDAVFTLRLFESSQHLWTLEYAIAPNLFIPTEVSIKRDLREWCILNGDIFCSATPAVGNGTEVLNFRSGDLLFRAPRSPSQLFTHFNGLYVRDWVTSFDVKKQIEVHFPRGRNDAIYSKRSYEPLIISAGLLMDSSLEVSK